jgi:transposase
VPALPSSLLEPVWVEFAALLPQRPEFDPAHPLGCHRRRIADRIVFEHIIDALVHGSGYERIATTLCSDTTIRRRLKTWAQAGIAQKIHALALAAYDKMIGLSLQDLAVDGAITKAPCGGERAGRSPVDRGKGGLKRSTQVEGDGIPLGVVSAPANRHDSPLLRPTCESAATQVGPMPDGPTMHLDRAYDNNPTRDLLDELGLNGEIARKGVPAPIQVGKRWVVERTNSWMNGYGKIRRCTDRDEKIVDFYLYLAAALVTIRQLIRRARTLYRWDARPTTRRIK